MMYLSQYDMMTDNLPYDVSMMYLSHDPYDLTPYDMTDDVSKPIHMIGIDLSQSI